MDQLLEVLKALSDETRMKILNLLLTNDLCVGALANNLGISEAAVSQHLQVLRKAGVIKGEKRGYFTHYYADKDVLKDTADKIIKTASQDRQCNGSCSDKRDENKPCHKKEETNGKM